MDATHDSLPRNAADLTPDWLTAALRPVLGAALRIEDSRTEPIGIGRGFGGQLLRVTPVYAVATEEAPRSLVAKLPSLDSTAAQLSAGMELDRKEASFYAELAEECPIRTPHCFFAGVELETGAGALLLEDLGEVGSKHPIDRCDIATATRVVEAAATFHAHFWNDARLETREWLYGRLDATHRGAAAMFPQGWPSFVRTAQCEIPASLMAAHERIPEVIASLADRGRRRPHTLGHGDFWLGNFAFPDAGLPLVLDWQHASTESPAADLACFIGCCLDVETRREGQDALLDHYLRVLLDLGVADYDAGQLREDFRYALLGLFAMPVLEALQLEGLIARRSEMSSLETQSLDAQLRQAMRNEERLIAAILDNDVLGLVPS